VLKGKKVLVGVTGSIAAYKTASLVRLLAKEGVEVKVIMTESSTSFITPLTLSTLSENKVVTKFEQVEGGLWNNHVDLGLWSDLLVVAPASANTISKFANGICDDFLSAVYLSARCKVVVAPAMDLDMFKHPAVQNNINVISRHGVFLIDPNEGELASGLIGKGRMAEPEEIIRWIKEYFENA
jgi:phosphopantothenoylcysteine decarboxylase/phosphopantothenate--cysteine ligase